MIRCFVWEDMKKMKQLIIYSLFVIIYVVYKIFILRWLIILYVNPTDIGDHALQFGGEHLFKKNIHSCFKVI